MTFILLAITIVIVAAILSKIIFIKIIQHRYERSLLKGDRKKSDQLGKIYYLSIDEEKRKAKGIVDIERKISDDFKSFNSRSISLMF
jgi:hypothetical protein